MMTNFEGISRQSASECDKNDVNLINLEDLFFSTRIIDKTHLLKAVLYIPFGLLLLVLRVIVCFFGVLTISLLPKTSHTRNVLLKGMCKILGLAIEVDDKYLDDTARLLIANHVSILDRLAVNVMVPCNTISKEFQIKNMESLWFWKDDVRYSRNLINEDVATINTYIEGSSVRILCFPEGTMTNGRIGLLKFHPGIFTLNGPVQPVLIWITMSSFITISPSIIGSTICGDILWAFFLPCTSFTLKVLPSIAKYPEESPEEYSKRVQEIMAKSLQSKATVYTASDKDELAKRLEITLNSTSVKTSSKFTAPAHGLFSINEEISKSSTLQTISMNTAAESFGKTPKQRMLSYQERRAKLLEASRIKYLLKQKKLNESVQ